MAHRAFARDDRRFPDLGPCPIRSGSPPGEAWTFMGTSPDAFDFPGAVLTIKCWLAPCPCCCAGWIALLPAGDAYTIAPLGCSAGCEAPAVAWWHLWRCGTLPPRLLADERARRYAGAVVRRTLADLPALPALPDLRRAAFVAGRWIAAGELEHEPVTRALLRAASRSGLEPAAIAPELAAAVLAGRARPGSVPA